MLPLDTRLILLGGTFVDAVSAVVIGYSVIIAFLSLMRLQGSDVARLLIAKGVLSALGFSVAGSLLKIIALQTWAQIRLFAFVFVLRNLLKRVFAWEENRIQERLVTRANAIALSRQPGHPLERPQASRYVRSHPPTCEGL